MQISSILNVSAFAMLAIYFKLFQNTMSALSPEDKNRILTQAKPGAKMNLLLNAPLIAFFFISDFTLMAILTVYAAIVTVATTMIHHKSLRDMGFDPAFVKRLSMVSLLSAFAVGLFLITALMDAKTKGVTP